MCSLSKQLTKSQQRKHFEKKKNMERLFGKGKSKKEKSTRASNRSNRHSLPVGATPVTNDSSDYDIRNVETGREASEFSFYPDLKQDPGTKKSSIQPPELNSNDHTEKKWAIFHILLCFTLFFSAYFLTDSYFFGKKPILLYTYYLHT